MSTWEQRMAERSRFRQKADDGVSVDETSSETLLFIDSFEQYDGRALPSRWDEAPVRKEETQ